MIKWVIENGGLNVNKWDNWGVVILVEREDLVMGRLCIYLRHALIAYRSPAEPTKDPGLIHSSIFHGNRPHDPFSKS